MYSALQCIVAGLVIVIRYGDFLVVCMNFPTLIIIIFLFGWWFNSYGLKALLTSICKTLNLSTCIPDGTWPLSMRLPSLAWGNWPVRTVGFSEVGIKETVSKTACFHFKVVLHTMNGDFWQILQKSALKKFHNIALKLCKGFEIDSWMKTRKSKSVQFSL